MVIAIVETFYFGGRFISSFLLAKLPPLFPVLVMASFPNSSETIVVKMDAYWARAFSLMPNRCSGSVYTVQIRLQRYST